ncbi:transcriptional regulator [Sphaerisporangium viridialbum]|uniref:ArsR/SmtB family transcription factor n=1 Tax=Sphaerisporangium viridialbum TaxID=46189 RepID=UPI003C729BA8
MGVVEWRFEADDLARLRFAFSPMWELVASLRVLRAPARHSVHLAWLRAVRPRLEAIDLSELFALAPTYGYMADFLTPPPDTPLPDFAAELARVRLTSPEKAFEEAGWVETPDTRSIDRFRADPVAGVQRVADTLGAYWELALAEFWPRVYGLLEADLMWRSRRLATGGATALFADLHPLVRWERDRLITTGTWCHSGEPTGDGVVLVPSAFRWPDIATMTEPYQPMLVYPARGVGTLWEAGPPPAPGALAALIGKTRAQLLLSLCHPASTTALARRMSLTPGAVSQHLTVLSGNGLVARRRLGREVLYRRTATGDALVSSS